jgi:hypothetical protein
MRAIASIALLGGSLAAAPLVADLPAWASAPASIAAGVLVAATACEGFGALTVATGALGALSYHLLAGESAALGGMAFVALALSSRSLRARSPRMRVAHGAVSALGGALAAYVALRYGGDGSLAVRAAAVMVAGILAAASLALPADDAVTYALASLAKDLPGATGDRLLRAAMLRRRVADSPAVESLADATAARVEQAWRALAEIATQRAVIGAAVGAPVLEQRITQHVEGLERIHAAAEERFARAAGMSDQRLEAARMDGETLETEVKALVEVMPG